MALRSRLPLSGSSLLRTALPAGAPLASAYIVSSNKKGVMEGQSPLCDCNILKDLLPQLLDLPAGVHTAHACMDPAHPMHACRLDAHVSSCLVPHSPRVPAG